MSVKAVQRPTEYERTALTKEALLEAASTLFAERGVEKTTIRDINQRAGQKNNSALQYHFGSKDGLIEALHIRHYGEELECRAKLVPEIFKPGEKPTARKVASLMVRSLLTLLKSNQGYCQWAARFGHVLAERGVAMYQETHADISADTAIIGQNLLSALPDTPQDILFYRLDQAIRFLALQSSVLAKNEAQLHGTYGALIEAMLIDTITGMFEADVSNDTTKTMKRLNAEWQA
ncbi:MAG: TetR/AcrR family transcriptional regulator [Alphaproteobacteria bacterium]